MLDAPIEAFDVHHHRATLPSARQQLPSLVVEELDTVGKRRGSCGKQDISGRPWSLLPVRDDGARAQWHRLLRTGDVFLHRISCRKSSRDTGYLYCSGRLVNRLMGGVLPIAVWGR